MKTLKIDSDFQKTCNLTRKCALDAQNSSPFILLSRHTHLREVTKSISKRFYQRASARRDTEEFLLSKHYGKLRLMQNNSFPVMFLNSRRASRICTRTHLHLLAAIRCAATRTCASLHRVTRKCASCKEHETFAQVRYRCHRGLF